MNSFYLLKMSEGKLTMLILILLIAW